MTPGEGARDYRLDMPVEGVLIPPDGETYIPRDHEHDFADPRAEYYRSYHVILDDEGHTKKIREHTCPTCGTHWLHY